MVRSFKKSPVGSLERVYKPLVQLERSRRGSNLLSSSNVWTVCSIYKFVLIMLSYILIMILDAYAYIPDLDETDLRHLG